MQLFLVVLTGLARLATARLLVFILVALLASLDMLFVASALLAGCLFLAVLLIVCHGHFSTRTGMVQRPNQAGRQKFHPPCQRVMQRTKVSKTNSASLRAAARFLQAQNHGFSPSISKAAL
ncbi:hypothetical protein Brsp05_03409 [Brucella sp. NBRC 12953]